MMVIYIIMCLADVIENVYYTDESIVSKRVEELNKMTNGGDFWYKTLYKN